MKNLKLSARIYLLLGLALLVGGGHLGLILDPVEIAALARPAPLASKLTFGGLPAGSLSRVCLGALA